MYSLPLSHMLNMCCPRYKVRVSACTDIWGTCERGTTKEGEGGGGGITDVESSHLVRHCMWKEWLQRMVRTESS